MQGEGTMDFREAVGQLRSMFSNLDARLLATVLESHSGHMERTVEYLLSLDEAELRELSEDLGIDRHSSLDDDGQLTGLASRAESRPRLSEVEDDLAGLELPPEE